MHDLFFFFQIFGLRPTRRGMPRVHWRAGRGRLTPTSFKSCQSDQPSPESKVEPQLANDKAAGESSGASYCLLYLLLARILSDSVVPLCLGCIHSFGRQLWGSLPPQLLPLLSPTSQVWSLKHFFSLIYLQLMSFCGDVEVSEATAASAF